MGNEPYQKMQRFYWKKYEKHNEKIADTMEWKYDKNGKQPTSKNENVWGGSNVFFCSKIGL